YQAGDDPRTIEWNITARSDRPYVRESLPDRGLDAWLLVDITRSLDWGTARCLKRQLALEFSAVVGQLLIGRGNRVGALLFEDRESGEQILVDTRSAHLRARFQLAAEAQRGTIRADLLRARASVAEISTAAELVPQLVAFIKQREAQRPGRLARLGA